MFWQLPQITIMAAGEVMFSLTGLEFAFSQVNNKYNIIYCHDYNFRKEYFEILQAPESMRAVLQALYTLTVAGGNAIDLIIIYCFGQIFPKQVFMTYIYNLS